MAYSNSYMLFLLGVSLILSSHVLAYNRPHESSLNYGEELDEQKGIDYVNAPKMNEELEAKKGMDYVNAPKIVSYEMPLEHSTYGIFNEEKKKIGFEMIPTFENNTRPRRKKLAYLCLHELERLASKRTKDSYEDSTRWLTSTNSLRYLKDKISRLSLKELLTCVNSGEELNNKKGVDHKKAPKFVAYEMPLEHTSSSEINDGGLDYIKVPRTDEVIEEHSKDYVKAPKNVDYEMPLEHTSYSDINDEKFDDQKVLDFVKSPKTAAYEMPPESPTYPEINANLDEALKDQKGEDSLNAQKMDKKFDDHKSVDSVDLIKAPKIDEKLDDNQKNVDFVDSVNAPKIDEKLDDHQKSVDSVEASKIDEKLDDQKDADSLKFSKIDETLNDQKDVDWISFHAKYPWIKKNSLTTGSRKLLLNHIANDESA